MQPRLMVSEATASCECKPSTCRSSVLRSWRRDSSSYSSSGGTSAGAAGASSGLTSSPASQGREETRPGVCSWFAVLKKRHPMRSEVGCGRVPENRPLRKTGKHIFYTELYTGQNKAAAMEANSLRTHQKVSSISRPPGQIANLAAGAESAQRVHHIIQ